MKMHRLMGSVVLLILILSGCGGGGGGSPAGTTTGGSIGTASASPVNVVATSNGASGVTISWDSVSGANGYNVYRATSSNQPLTSMLKVNSSLISYSSLPYFDVGLSSSTTYYYKVTADIGGVESSSAEVSSTTLASTTLHQMGGSIQGNPLTLTGTVTTVTAGLSTPSFITTDGTFVYVSDQASRTVLKVDPVSGGYTVLLGTVGVCGIQVCSPRGLTTDGTSLFVVDQQGSVRKVDLATGVSSTFVSGLSLPTGITTDGTNLYVSDFNGVKKISIASGSVLPLSTTRATDLTTDGNTLYVIIGNAIQKMDMVTGQISSFAGSVAVSGQLDGVGGAATFTSPGYISTDGKTLYINQYVSSTNFLPARTVDIATATVSTYPVIKPGLGVTTDGNSLFFIDGNLLKRIQ